MPNTIQLAESQLIGTLTSAINNSDVTPSFTCTFIDKDTGNARIPSSTTHVFVIGRGTSNFEIFYGTTSTTSGVTTITTTARGLPKDGSTTPLVAVAANYESHFAGDEISVVDISTYLNILALKLNGADSLQNTIDMGTNKILNLATPTLSTDAANKSYVDGVAIAGGANASSTVKGISKLSLDPVSLTNPIAVGDNDTRVPIALVSTSAGAADVNKVPKLNASGIIDTTMKKDTLANQITGVTNATGAQLETAFNGASANVTATNLNTLTNGSNANALHHHNAFVTSDTRVGTAVSGAVTYAHGLGVAPTLVTINALAYISLTINNSSTVMDRLAISNGGYDGANNKCSYKCSAQSDASTSATQAAAITDFSPASSNNSQAAVVSVDATNITLTWTKYNSGFTNTIYLTITAKV